MMDHFKSELSATEMGRKLNLSHLSEDECEKILAVIQRDFDLRNQEKERLGKLEAEIEVEKTKDSILSKERNFSNENCCMRCLATFVFLFRRRLQCYHCRHWVCKDCSKYDEIKKEYLCTVCQKEFELGKQSNKWFYTNVRKKFKHFGSAKVVRSLYKYGTTQSGSDLSETESSEDRRRRSSFDSVCSKETQRFREELQELVQDLDQALDNNMGSMQDGSSSLTNERLDRYEARISSALRDFAQGLHLAVDNQNPSGDAYPVTKHHEVEHILTKHVEDYLGDSLHMEPGDFPESEITNGNQEYEDILARAIVSKVSKQHNKSSAKKNVVNQELAALINTPPKPPPIVRVITEENVELPTPPESPVRKSIVKTDSVDLESELSRLEHVTQKRELILPTFNIDDDGALDPDLLATGTETEDDMGDYPDNASSLARWENDSNISSVSMRSWKANWFFREKNVISMYDNMGQKVFNSDNEENVMMFVPKSVDSRVRIGNRDVDEMSELSENRSEFSDLSDVDDKEEVPKASAQLQEVTSQIVAEFKVSKQDSSDSSDLDVSHTSDFGRTGLAPSNLDTDSDTEEIVQKRRVNKPRSSVTRNVPSHQSSSSSQTSQSPVPAPRRKLNKGTTPTETKKAEMKSVVEKGTECKDISFRLKPKTVSVCDGETAKVTCEINSIKPVDLFWYRDYGDRIEQLETSDKYDMTDKNKSYSLEVYDCTVEDYGQYLCIATNELGSSNWCFGLKIKDGTTEMSTPAFIKDISDLNVAEGQSVKFRVKVKGYPHPRVLWYKDGRMIEDCLEYRIERIGNRDYALILDYVTLDHDAEYMVIAKNRSGQVKSTAELIVEPKTNDEPVVTLKKSSKVITPSITSETVVPRNSHNVDYSTMKGQVEMKKQVSVDSAIFSAADADSDKYKEDILRCNTNDLQKTSAGQMEELASPILVAQSSSESVTRQQQTNPEPDPETLSSPPVYKSLRDALKSPPPHNIDFSFDAEIADAALKKFSVEKTLAKKVPSDPKSFTITTTRVKTVHQVDILKTPEMPYDEFEKQYDSGKVGFDTISRGTQRQKLRASVSEVDEDDIGNDVQPYVDCGLKRVDSKRYKRDYVVNKSPAMNRKQLTAPGPTNEINPVTRSLSGDQDQDDLSIKRSFDAEEEEEFKKHNTGTLVIQVGPGFPNKTLDQQELDTPCKVSEKKADICDLSHDNIVLKGHTAEDELPESRSEFSSDVTDFQLPSVKNIASMFGSPKLTTSGSAIKRVKFHENF